MLKSKFLKFSAFSLAAIALAFNFAACDSGNDEYIPETPTTWYDFATGADNGACTAHWTFATDKASIGASEVSLEDKEIPADEGTGATLVGANGLGIKYNTGLQAGRKSVVLEENPGDGPALKLTTKAQTNLTFKVAGAGAADPSRIFLITDEAGKNLVWKSNLASVTSIDATTVFHLKGAPAGVYYIYFNGSKIWEINASATDNDVAEPLPYSTADDWVISSDKETFIAITQNAQISLTKPKVDENGEPKVDDLTNSAVWKIMSGEDIARVDLSGKVSANSAASEGTVVVRGRIGRFYKDITLTINKNDDLLSVDTYVTTVASGNLPKVGTKITDFSENGADIAKVLKTNVTGKALVTAESATIEIGDALKTLYPGTDDDGNFFKYVYNEETKSYEEESSETYANDDKDEIWIIKDTSAKNGGLSVKGLPKKPIAANQHFYTLKVKVTPKPGKKLTVIGVMACLNSGRGLEGIDCTVSVNDKELGSFLSTKNSTDGNPSFFDSEYTLETETEFVFKFCNTDKFGKAGHSVQLKDLSLLIKEN